MAFSPRGLHIYVSSRFSSNTFLNRTNFIQEFHPIYQFRELVRSSETLKLINLAILLRTGIHLFSIDFSTFPFQLWPLWFDFPSLIWSITSYIWHHQLSLHGFLFPRLSPILQDFKVSPTTLHISSHLSFSLIFLEALIHPNSQTHLL